MIRACDGAALRTVVYISLRLIPFFTGFLDLPASFCLEGRLDARWVDASGEGSADEFARTLYLEINRIKKSACEK